MTWGTRSIAKLVNITTITVEFMVLTAMVAWPKKSPLITMGPHIAMILN